MRAKEWRKKYGIDKLYEGQGLTDSQLDEEAIAEAFRHFALNGTDAVDPARRIFLRVMRFLQAIGDRLRGEKWNFQTAEEIFAAIERGEVAPRIDRPKREPVRDFNGDMILFSLPNDKDKALKEAEEALKNVKGIDGKFRPSIGKVASYILHPHQVASIYESFTPVYILVINMMRARDVIVHKLSNHMDIYNKIDRDSKKKIDAVLEIGRLTNTNFSPENGEITVSNPGINTAHHSKPGEIITLNELEAKAYAGVRQAMNMALDTYKKTILEEYGYSDKGIENEKDLQDAMRRETEEKEILRMQNVLKILQDIEAAKRMGYIPLKRWGEIGITIRSKDGKELIHFERIELSKVPGQRKKIIGDNKEVRDALLKLVEKYPSDQFDIDTFEVKDFSSLKSKLNLNELDLLAANSDMSQGDYDELRSMLEDAIARRGFRAHFFKSNDVPGYDPDFERALNDYVVSIAGHLARRSNMKKIDKAIKRIEESGEVSLFDYARRYVDYATDPVEEFSALRQMGFMWYLAGNLASGITNASQPFMVTAPWLKSMFSHSHIASQMGKAYSDTVKMIDMKSGTDVFNFDKAPDDVKSALKKAEAEGEFLPLNTFDAMAIANTSVANLRGLDRKAREAMDVLSMTFSVPERTNRVVTYITAYRFAIDPKNRQKIMAFVGRDQIGRAALSDKTGAEFAEAFADYAVYSTQYRMGRTNRPRIGRGIGTLPTQFMSYTLQSLELMHRLKSIHGAKSGTSLGIMILMVVAMSGIKGIPFEDDLVNFFEAMWKLAKRTDLDVNSEMRKALFKAVGPKMTEAIMRGLPAALLDVDMSGRLGMGNIVPDDQGDLLGIWYDMIVKRPLQAVTDLQRGDTVQALADISPAIFKNILQAYEWANTGVKSSKTGDTIIIPEDLDKNDIGLKILGFTAADISRERERVYAEQRASRAVDDIRADYYDILARAIVARNKLWEKDRPAAEKYQAQIEQIFSEIARYNLGVEPYRMVVITPRSLKQRVNEEMLGASANKVRKQARGEAATLKEAYSK